VNPVAWEPARDLDAREWIAVGRRIGTVGRGIQWLLGDWLRYGNARFGERYSRASTITGYDTQTLMNMVYVASRFEISRRREKLTWSHHETLASLPSESQDRWLNLTLEHGWAVSDLRTSLRQARLAGEEGGPSKVKVADDVGAGRLVGTVLCPHCQAEVPISPDLLASIVPGGKSPTRGRGQRSAPARR
jgi:hypothetical protein